MAHSRAIAGAFRARNNCSRRNARLPSKESSTLEGVAGKSRRRRKLSARLYASDALRPILLELDVTERQVFHRINVVEQKIVARARFEEFLLNRQPGSFVDPHLDLDDLVADLIGLGSQFKNDRFLAVEFFFTDYGHQVALPDVVALRTEPEKHVLIDHRTVLAEVEFFDAVYLWIENKERVAGTQNGARVRLGNLDAHFLIAADIDVACFYRGIFHHRRVFDVFDIGTEGMEVLRGLVHHSQDASDGPVCGRLGGARVKRTRRATQNHKREEKKQANQIASFPGKCDVSFGPSES